MQLALARHIPRRRGQQQKGQQHGHAEQTQIQTGQTLDQRIGRWQHGSIN
jgi:hypothetical protein